MDYFKTQADFEAALQARLQPLLTELAEAKDKAERMKANRDKILDEKKSLEGKTLGKTVDGIIRTADAIILPREMARDTATYQKWRAHALDEGISIKVADDLEPADQQGPNTFTDDRTHYVSAAYLQHDGAKYRAERAFAESKGLVLRVMEPGQQWPEGAK